MKFEVSSIQPENTTNKPQFIKSNNLQTEHMSNTAIMQNLKNKIIDKQPKNSQSMQDVNPNSTTKSITLMETFKKSNLYQNICKKLSFKKATDIISKSINLSNKRNTDLIDDEMDEPDFGGSKKRLNTYAESKDKKPL